MVPSVDAVPTADYTPPMQRLSVRLPDAAIDKLTDMLDALPEPTIGPKPTMADVLRVVVERGLGSGRIQVFVNGDPMTIDLHGDGALFVSTTTAGRVDVTYRRR